MEKLFTGIKDMRRVPEAIFIADINHDDIALAEAKKMKVKIFAIVDSNSNPEHVDVMVPANDDATEAVSLITKSIASAVSSGRSKAATIVDRQ
jgi:small subunit ribosomal protein S2